MRHRQYPRLRHRRGTKQIVKTKITQSIVANMQAAAQDIVVVDDSLPGFVLRIRPTGTKIWYFRYRTAGGPQRRLVLGRYPGVGAAAARQLALQAAGDVARGVDVLVRKREVRAEGERARHSTLRTFVAQRYEPWALTYLKSGEFQVAHPGRFRRLDGQTTRGHQFLAHRGLAQAPARRWIGTHNH